MSGCLRVSGYCSTQAKSVLRSVIVTERHLCARAAIVVLSLQPMLLEAADTVLYNDDFEGPVTGWSINSTEYDPDTTRFLGRFDNSPTQTERTFTVPPGSDRVEIEFDFYRMDSWDNNARWGFDRFEIDIDGRDIFSLPFGHTQEARSGVSGLVEWAHYPLSDAQEFAFGTGIYWRDQKHRFTITVYSPGPSLTLTLRANINQGGNDESAGYDNMRVTAVDVPPNLELHKEVIVLSSLGPDATAIPGSELQYTIRLSGSGSETKTDSIILLDDFPPELELYTGDLDGYGNPFVFIDDSTPSSGLSCCHADSYEFSNSDTKPPVFGYIPEQPYDPNITYIRISPTGAMRDANIDPVEVRLEYRARIK